MSDDKHKNRYVLLPPESVLHLESSGTAVRFLSSRAMMSPGPRSGSARPEAQRQKVSVLDPMGETDAKLVEMTETQRLQLRVEEPGLRVVRVVDVHPLWTRDRLRSSIASASSTSPKHEFEVTVTDSVSGRPVKGAQVIAFTNRKDAIGQQNTTNARGVAKFRLPRSIKKLDTVLADALHTYWPVHRSPVELKGLTQLEIALPPLEILFLDCRRFFNGDGADTNGAGVRVAVIDSGIAEHKDLVFTGKMNTARGEKPTETGDNGLGHGTHVAGIIAGRGKKDEGVRGVAPGVELFGYRVFAKDSESAESFAIAKAIRQAAEDGCHLINLSLGDPSEMPDVLREIRRARSMGVLCIAATGNDRRQPVNFPAGYPEVIAVAAMGRKGCFPRGAAQELEVAKPLGKDSKNFVAAFSNIGEQVDLVGPGVGVVSCFPGGYAVFDGTSMACPAMTGAIANILSKNRTLLNAEPNQERADKMAKRALKTAKRMGFGPKLEGLGHLS